MRLELKGYQRDCLNRLGQYLRRAREIGNTDTAFWEMTTRNPTPAPEGLTGMPYVCFRVPTGGGKTLMAAHAVKPVVREWLQRERGVVLWLAPTTKIVEQTLEALKDRRHPYRLALDEHFDGRVEVMDLEAALSIGKAALDGALTVIVTTIQAHRVREEIERRVTRENGRLMDHFTLASAEQKQVLRELNPDDPLGLTPNLQNVLRMHRPLVIVDEAHNARSPLSFETLARFNPSCIVEFTATPREDSNVLHAVSAAELKADDMLKLPLRMRAKQTARDSVVSAVAKRDELKAISAAQQAKGEQYIRPIVLYHAESGDDAAYGPEQIKALLRDELKIDEQKIAICAKNVDEIPNTPILSESNPIEHVITIQKLREGWDCPFAYVLCSVANLSSTVAVEQIIGRVLRMPYAKRRGHDDLNCAYAYVVSPNFREAVNQLEDAIVGSGFTKYEASRAIVREPEEPGGGLFGQVEGEPAVEVALSARPSLEALAEDQRACVVISEQAGQIRLRWEGPPMLDATAETLSQAVESPADKQAIEVAKRRSRGEAVSPAALGKTFRLPGLAIKTKDDPQKRLLEDQPLEAEWNLTECNHQLDPSEFSLPAEQSKVAVVDVNERGDLHQRFVADMDRQLMMLESDAPRTPAELAVWLGYRIEEPSIFPSQKQLFLLRMVEYLVAERDLEIEKLSRHRFRLCDAAAAKIAAHRLQAEADAYQQLLDDTFVDDDLAFELPVMYPANSFYPRPDRFEKHFYSDVGEMNGEEAKFAMFLDSLPQVEYWVRNLERKRGFFRLRMPHGYFWPDFCAQLIDERKLVVEFKGPQLKGSERDQTETKEQVGKLWAARGEGDHLFALVTAKDYEHTIRELLS